MKKKIETETYRFIGDSTQNLATLIENRKAVGNYTQTSIIKALSDNKQYVVSGQKLKSSIDSTRQAYLISYGKDKENVDQIIKIIVDKENLEKGDPNVLAIDNLCNQSINVKIKNTAIKVICGAALALVTIGVVHGIVKADEKEFKANSETMTSYVDELNEERLQNGVNPIEMNNVEIQYENIEENYNRSR